MGRTRRSTVASVWNWSRTALPSAHSEPLGTPAGVRLDEAVRAHGVTTTEYVTLSVLRERDGLSCAQLARWAFVTPQAMNLVVKALPTRYGAELP